MAPKTGTRPTIRIAVIAALAGAAVLVGLTAGSDRVMRTTRFADGSPWSRIHFRDGVPDGRWTTWYENGQVKSEGDYALGLRTGEWSTWFEDGRRHSQGRFELGERHLWLPAALGSTCLAR